MRQTSGTIIWCLGVILGVTIVQGRFHYRPEWEDDILEDNSDEYMDDFYAPVRLGRQAPSSPLASSRTSLEDLQSIINQFAQSTEGRNARPMGLGHGQSYSQGSSSDLGSGYGYGSELGQSYSQGSSSDLGSGYGYGSELGQSYSQGSSSVLGSGLAQSYSQGSSSDLGSGYGYGSELGQSYSQGSSSVLGSGLAQSYSQGSSSVLESNGYGSGLSQSYSQGSSSGSASASGSVNSQSSFLAPGVGSGYRPTSGEQKSLLPSNGNQQASSELSSLNSLLNTLQQKVEQVKSNINSLNGHINRSATSNPSNVESSELATNGLKLFKEILKQSSPSKNQGQSIPSTSTNLSHLSQKNQLLKQAAILLSKLSTNSGISKSDIIKIIKETADDIKQYPSTKKSVLNLEIQVLHNLVNRLKRLENSSHRKSVENSSNLKIAVKNILESLNNIVQSIWNNGNGNPIGPSVSSDPEIGNILYILNVIHNLVNDLQKAVNNTPSSSNTSSSNGPSSTHNSMKIPLTSDSPTSSSSALRDICDALLNLMETMTEGVDHLLKNIIRSNYPSDTTGPYSGSQPFQSDKKDLESTIKHIQKAAKNLEAVVNSKLISDNNYEPSTSSNSKNNHVHDNDYDWTNKRLLKDSTNVLESVTGSGNRNPTTPLSPANDSSKILKIRKLLLSLLNDPSSTLSLSQIVTGLRAQDVIQAMKNLNSPTVNLKGTRNPSNNANSRTIQGTITIDETERPVVDNEGKYYTLRQGNYKIAPSSGGIPIFGRYLVDDISSIAYSDGSVRTIKSGPFSQTSGRLCKAGSNFNNGLCHDYHGSTSSSSSKQSNNEGATYTSDNNLNSQHKSDLKNLRKFSRPSDATSSTSKSPSSSDSNSSYGGTSPSSSSPSTTSASSSSSESSITDFTLKQDISKLIKLPSSGDPNSSSGPSSSSTSTNSQPTNSGLPSSLLAELQNLSTTLSTHQSSTAKSSSSSASSSPSFENSGSSQYINSATSGAESQPSSIISIDSSSESSLYPSLIQLKNSPSRSSSGKHPSSSLYPGLENLHINSGHDTRVIIKPGCSKSTDTSSSDSISDGNSVSSGASSSHLSSSTSTSSSSSSNQFADTKSGISLTSDDILTSPSGSSASSRKRYQGFDTNSDTADYTLVSASADGPSGFVSGQPPRTASGQYSNSGSSFGYGSVTLPRANVISAIGDENLLPGNQVQVITKNGVKLNGYIKDSHGPITFVRSDPSIPLNDSEETGRIWKISSSNFNDDDFDHLEQCGCIDD